jgi:hypothetical protein
MNVELSDLEREVISRALTVAAREYINDARKWANDAPGAAQMSADNATVALKLHDRFEAMP